MFNWLENIKNESYDLGRADMMAKVRSIISRERKQVKLDKIMLKQKYVDRFHDPDERSNYAALSHSCDARLSTLDYLEYFITSNERSPR